MNRTVGRGVGLCLILAGVLTFLINAGLTPFLPRSADAAAAPASSIFAVRQGLSAIVALLLLIASGAIFLKAIEEGRKLLAWSAAVAFLGSAALFAQEWAEVFFVHYVAKEQPLAFAALDAAEGINLPDRAAIAALCTFALGWIALAVTTLRIEGSPKAGAWLLIAGFFAIPILSGLLGPIGGAALGNAFLGAGWVLLGRARSRDTRATLPQ